MTDLGSIPIVPESVWVCLSWSLIPRDEAGKRGRKRGR